MRIYVANATYASETALVHLVERDDDVVLIAEHHKDKVGTGALISFFGRHGWKATASPSRPTERSAKGTTGGVIAAIKNHIDHRPPSIATDPEGKLTSSAQLTGRMIVLAKIEILTLAGDLLRG